MTKLTNNQKILNWAKNHTSKPFSNIMRELNQTNEATTKFAFWNLKRKGLINYTIKGRALTEIKLTKLAYQYRSTILA